MKIFVLTDNLLWLEKIESMFAKFDYDVDLYCSPAGTKIFEEQITTGRITPISLRENLDFFLANYELGFSCHCKQIFPPELVQKIRCINIHPGLNPFNRGWFPQVFSILNDAPVGVTIHLMDREVDHGPIIFQEQCDINPWDTSKDIYDRIMKMEFEIFERELQNLIDGKYLIEIPCGQGNVNTIKDYKELLEIDLERQVTMKGAIDLLRALTHPPYKNGFFIDQFGQKIYVEVKLTKEESREIKPAAVDEGKD